MSIQIEGRISRDLIPAKLMPAIVSVTDMYRETFSSRLQSVYLLGGIARGEFRPGSSDFDIRAIVSKKEEGEKERVDRMAKLLQKEFDFGKMELDVYTIDGLNKRNWLQFYVLVDGVCVWGEPYRGTFSLPTTKEALASMLASHLLEHYKRTPESLRKIKEGMEKGDPETWRTYAKRAIRLGNVISILKTGQYTQNSEKMVNDVIKNVPEIAESIAKLNQYRISPPDKLDGYIDLAKQAEIVRESVLRHGLK